MGFGSRTLGDLRVPRTFALTRLGRPWTAGLCSMRDTQDFCIDAHDAIARVAGVVRLQRIVAGAPFLTED
jgi:hypothetical protein